MNLGTTGKGYVDVIKVPNQLTLRYGDCHDRQDLIKPFESRQFSQLIAEEEGRETPASLEESKHPCVNCPWSHTGRNYRAILGAESGPWLSARGETGTSGFHPQGSGFANNQ